MDQITTIIFWASYFDYESASPPLLSFLFFVLLCMRGNGSLTKPCKFNMIQQRNKFSRKKGKRNLPSRTSL